jgi:hypothetical protein
MSVFCGILPLQVRLLAGANDSFWLRPITTIESLEVSELEFGRVFSAVATFARLTRQVAAVCVLVCTLAASYAPLLAALSGPECQMACCRRKENAHCCQRKGHQHSSKIDGPVLVAASGCPSGCAQSVASASITFQPAADSDRRFTLDAKAEPVVEGHFLRIAAGTCYSLFQRPPPHFFFG